MDDMISKADVLALFEKHVGELLNYATVWAAVEDMTGLDMAEHDACVNCKYIEVDSTADPCNKCMHNYTDMWEMKRPDKIDIVKLCASEEYKQLEQYNISGNKYHLGFANACAWIMNKYREG